MILTDKKNRCAFSLARRASSSIFHKKKYTYMYWLETERLNCTEAPAVNANTLFHFTLKLCIAFAGPRLLYDSHEHPHENNNRNEFSLFV